MNYIKKLKNSAKETKSIACMGLDPVVEAMPTKYAEKGIKAIVDYFYDISSLQPFYGV